MRGRFVIILIGLFLAALGAASLAAQESAPKRRVALVVGNSAYLGPDTNPKYLAKLVNPVGDAHTVAGLLKQYGVEVTEGYDLDRERFVRLLQRFSRETAGAETAFVFYAGHGMEVTENDDLINVLAPTDAEIDCDTREHFNTIKLEDVTTAIRGTPNRIFILDACRDNPFPRCPVRAGSVGGYGFRGADLKARRGEAVLLVYSTGQKSLASDGPQGQHSPFAKELLSLLRNNPQAQFLPLMNRLVVNVANATKFAQVPSVTIYGGIPFACLEETGCTSNIEDIETQRQRVRLVASNAEQQAKLVPGVIAR
jgi:uncharacterized caspase-like protein